MRIRWSSLIPVGVSFVAWLSSPAVLSVLPEKVAHGVLLGGILVQTILPAVVTSHPTDQASSH